MKKFKTAILLSVAFVSLAAIWNYMQDNGKQTRAAAEPITIQFQQNQVSVPPTGNIEVNVFFLTNPNIQVSGASLVFSYPATILEYVAPTDETYANTSCTNFKFKNIVKQTNDAAAGQLRLGRVVLDSNANLPSGIFCFATVTFRPKTGITLPANGIIQFNQTSPVWEIVGPTSTFTTQIDATKGQVAVTVAQPPSPTPTRTPTPSPTRTPTPSNTPMPTLTPTITPIPCLKSEGDADCNGAVNLIDFEIWRKEYNGELLTKIADFSGEGMVNLVDFEIWRKKFF